MQRRYWLIIIGVSIPVAFFGILTLVIAVNIIQVNSDSDKWMVELESHLTLSEMDLLYQMRNEDIKELKIYKVRYLDDFLDGFPSYLKDQFKDSLPTDNRYVFYIDKNSGYSNDEVHEILVEVNGIKNAQIVFSWMLGKNCC